MLKTSQCLSDNDIIFLNSLLYIYIILFNYTGIYFLADLYMCGELEMSARQFIFQNFLDVIHSEEFLQLSEDRLITLLRSDKLQVTSENQVLEATLSWIHADPENRTRNACHILQYVKLALIDLSYLENIVLKLDFVKNCLKCQQLIGNAIALHYDQSALELLTPRAQPPCVYVVGGRNSTDCQLKSMERYDFLIDQWHSVVSIM